MQNDFREANKEQKRKRNINNVLQYSNEEKNELKMSIA